MSIYPHISDYVPVSEGDYLHQKSADGLSFVSRMAARPARGSRR